jgi:hypothetical protein
MTQYVLKQVKKVETPVLLWIAGFTLFALFVAYIYFINGAIAFAVESKDINAESRGIVASMSDLETTYTTLRGTVDESMAEGLGFKKSTEDVKFVSIGASRGLSFNKGL